MSGIDERMERFAELDAGRALGDLDAAEAAEWQALSEELGLAGDPALDLLAAQLEAACIGRSSPALPTGLAAGLERIVQRPAVAHDARHRRTSVIAGPWLGWAVAAGLLLLLVLQVLLPGKAPTAADHRAALLSRADDLTRLEFSSTGGNYAGATGELLWSDARQEGYMTLSNLPANDPSQRQYQLWIVDPTRDEFPVDGGVFDIPAGSGSVVIPIQAKLAVRKPAAFVITLEQPGGVVRSKQEVVVALAKS
jgi:hypothetical protein